MMATKTIKLDAGKYEFDIEDCRLKAARRGGEDWPAGLEYRFQHAFVAALLRIEELETAVATGGDTQHCHLCGADYATSGGLVMVPVYFSRCQFTQDCEKRRGTG
jgi:hypothetical protein